MSGGSLLSDHTRSEIDRWVAKFPEGRQRSALLSALQVAQHENKGYLTRDIMDAVAEYLNLQPIEVYEVATFYSMFETKPVGRHSISVCTNISCMLRGADDIVNHLLFEDGRRVPSRVLRCTHDDGESPVL